MSLGRGFCTFDTFVCQKCKMLIFEIQTINAKKFAGTINHGQKYQMYSRQFFIPNWH